MASPRCFALPRWLDRAPATAGGPPTISGLPQFRLELEDGSAVTACGRGLIGRQPVPAVDEHVDHFVTLADDTLVVSTHAGAAHDRNQDACGVCPPVSLWQMESVVTAPATSVTARRSRRSVPLAGTHR